jgi:hypothetical protein
MLLPIAWQQLTTAEETTICVVLTLDHTGQMAFLLRRSQGGQFLDLKGQIIAFSKDKV